MARDREREKQRRAKVMSASKKANEHESGYAPTAFKLPEGITLYQLKEGKHDLTVVPFIAAEGNPYSDPGFLYYERTFFVHRGVGPRNRTYVCPAFTFDHSCPICEERERLKSRPGADKDTIKSLYPKERQLMLVIDNKSKDKALQLFEGPYSFGLGQLIDDKIKYADERLGYADFHDPDDGFDLSIGVKAEKSDKGSYDKPVNLEFIRRDKPISDDILESAPCLDELLIEEEYDDLKRLFFQTGMTDTEEPTRERSSRNGKADESEPPARGRKREEPVEKTAEELGIEKGSIVDSEFGECEVIKVSRDGTSLTLVDGEDEEHMGVNPNDVTLVPDDEPEEPKTRGRKQSEPEEDEAPKSRRRSTLEPEEDEEPAPRSRRRAEPEPEPEDDPAPRRRRAPVDDEPIEEPAPRRRR